MSRLTDLIRKAKTDDQQLGADLEREFRALSSRLSFGLNFERHKPEAVELPNRPVRKGEKVRVLPPRGTTTKGDQRLWQVKATRKGKNEADLVLPGPEEAETQTVSLDDLIVVAEFGDTIYPGLTSTGKVSRGKGKPWHTVINGENYHVLKALTWTHRGKVDAIYIDPPYNTGAKDWKYNNDYVEGEDLYRHSKWLAMMERRLLVAKELLNPVDSVLIVTIDEKEYLRLGLLLEQVLPDFGKQMVTIVSNPKGVTQGYLSRVEEYAFFCFSPQSTIFSVDDDLLSRRAEAYEDGLKRPRWKGLLRSGDEALRSDREKMFYPVWINPETKMIVRAGDYLPADQEPDLEAKDAEGNVAAWPIRSDKSLGRWSIGAETLNDLVKQGLVKAGRFDEERKTWGLSYLSERLREELNQGILEILNRDNETGVADVAYVGDASKRVRTVWHRTSHDAGAHGTDMVGNIVGSGRAFPFPKSLYAVEDALRIAVKGKLDATILDFFAGSGTTAHAVMRLNRQDGGQRQCISVTNNEVAADEQKALREQDLRPGDPEWEKYGICDYITKPRVEAAITGITPNGTPISGNYLFGKPVEDEMSRSFKHIGFTDAKLFNTATKKKQLVALIDGLPQSLVKGDCPFIVSEEHSSSVLFDTDFKDDWLEALDGQDQVKDFYIVAPVKRIFDELKKEVSELLGPIIVRREQEIPMSDGFEENAEFFTLTYETPLAVSYQTAFARIAPLLWLRAGSTGTRIDKLPSEGWDVAETYGLLIELDRATDFLKAVRKAEKLRVAYIVTDDERRFQSLARRLPEGVEAVRLYESYLTNFAFANGDDA